MTLRPSDPSARAFRPRHRGDVERSPAKPPETGTFLRLPGHDKAALLNRSAYEIWRLCDGWRTEDEIVHILARRYGLSPNALRSNVGEAILETEVLGLIEGPRTKSKSVTIMLNPGADEGRGFFAIFHYIWSALYLIKSEYAKRVALLEEDQGYWDALFEASTDLLEPGGQNITLAPHDYRILIEQFPELVREDHTLEVLPHHLLTWPSGREFAENVGNRRVRRRMHRVFSTFVKPRGCILDEVDAFCNSGMGNCPTIGMHLRSTRHLGMVMDSQQFVQEIVVEEVKQLVAKHDLDHYRVYIATHVGDYVQHCKQQFGDRLLVREFKRDSDPARDHYHLDAPRAEMARDVLIDCLILSRCDFVVGVPSNVLLAALIFNPENDLQIFDYALDLKESPVFDPA